MRQHGLYNRNNFTINSQFFYYLLDNKIYMINKSLTLSTDETEKKDIKRFCYMHKSL